VKNTIYAVVAASLAMLSTSGLVALATAAEPEPKASATAVQEADDYISEFIDREYRKILAQEKR
jgi:hypothetical protein